MLMRTLLCTLVFVVGFASGRLSLTQPTARTLVVTRQVSRNIHEEKYGEKDFTPPHIFRDALRQNWEAFVRDEPFPEFDASTKKPSRGELMVAAVAMGSRIQKKPKDIADVKLDTVMFPSFSATSKSGGWSIYLTFNDHCRLGSPTYELLYSRTWDPQDPPQK